MDEGAKSPFSSKTIHFNVWTFAAWTLLPKGFRDKPDSMMYVTAWLSIGNIVLRFVTREALQLWSLRAKK